MAWLIAIVGILVGWGIAHTYHIFSGRARKKEFERLTSDNSRVMEYMQEMLVKYDRSLSKMEEKEHFRADSEARLEGVFHTFPWEGEYAKEVVGEADIRTVVTQAKSPHKKGSEGEDGSPMEF